MARTIAFDLDDSQFVQRLGVLNEQNIARARDAMQTVVQDLERKAGELVPVDEGTLLRSATSSVSPQAQKMEVEGSVSYNTPYAVNVHERMKPAIPPAGAQMNPGPRTSAKPGNEFGPAGGWYLRRPLLGKYREYVAYIARKVKM